MRRLAGLLVVGLIAFEDSTPETYGPDASEPPNPAIEDVSYQAPPGA
ncbi:MAG: hypothetical protein IRZ07_25875 [Microbispora sp.]|nr:hypothetical protein [Microbispora sp.]